MSNKIALVAMSAMLGLLLASNVSAQAEVKAVTLEGQITEVTVFPTSANVTRTVKLEGEPGPYEISLKNLPEKYVTGSIRARTVGEAKVFDVRVEEKKVTKLSNEAKEARRMELQKIDETLEQLRDERKAVDVRISFLDDLRTSWSGGKRSPSGPEITAPTVTQAGEALKFLEQYEKLLTVRRDIDAQVKKLTTRLSVLKTELSEAEKADTVTERRPVIRVEKFGRLPVTVLVEYGVVEAGWSAAYDLRAENSKATKVELTYYAELHQKSGEDWPAARITFSTAAPAAGVDLPSLEPLYVAQNPEPLVAEAMVARFLPPGYIKDFGSTVPKFDLSGGMAGGGGGGGGSSLFSASEGSEEGEVGAGEIKKNKEAARFSMQEGTTYATFTAPGTQAVPADGTARRVLVTTNLLPTAQRLIAVPKLSDKVFLTTEMRNEGTLPLLPATAKIYMGSDYLGEMSVPAIAVGEKFSASFGALNGFKVSRKKVTITDSAVGMFSKRRRVEYEMQIRIENLTKDAGEVEVQEALPISQQKEITIKVTAAPIREVADEAAKHLKEDNVRTWLVTVQPGEAKAEVIKYGYSVEWDRDKFLYGSLD
jgi:hypothetical protein